MASVSAPCVLMLAGTSKATGPTGDSGALPSAANSIVVTGSGAPAVPASVTPFAVA